MKKNFLLFMTAVVLMAGTACITSCGGSDNDDDEMQKIDVHPSWIIGTWERNGYTFGAGKYYQMVDYIFYSDGSGVFKTFAVNASTLNVATGKPSSESNFTWSLTNNILYLTYKNSEGTSNETYKIGQTSATTFWMEDTSKVYTKK